MSEQKCPHCGFKIGAPMGSDGKDFKLTAAPTMCFCIRCLGVVWLSEGKEPRAVTNRELFLLCTHRPHDLLPMMAVALKCNANLPLIDSSLN
jgi:hypothetical protein